MNRDFFHRVYMYLKDGSFFHRLWIHLFFTRKFYKVYNFFRPQRINPKKIVMCNFVGLGYGCNPKYLAEYILSHNLDYEIVWFMDSHKLKPGNTFPKNIRTVELFSKEAVKELSSAGIWIDNCRKGWFPRKKPCQLYVQTWHGGFACKKIEKDAPHLPKSYVKLARKDSKTIDLITTDSSVNTAIFRNSFWYSGEILECGTPRTDIFFDKQKVTAATIKIHDEYKIPHATKIALYAPTFRQSLTLAPYMLDYESAQKFLEEKFGGDWQLCVRLHPNVALKSAELNIPENVNDLSDYADMQEILCASDAVITDYSGIMFDYWFLSRPVFLFATDYEEYTENDRAFYVPIEKLPFSIAKNNEELKKNIENFDDEDFCRKLDSFKSEYGIASDGHACQKVMEWLENKQREIFGK